ncbi:hypothetical protein B0T14DRAFT_495969 [Immersiella caudata]|uniref:Uncharacterized protein n=1 Tax=Immersiella caudata TaxID=314043 RepID=A0AA39WPE6_9PEZI|nr:hypothetical protein B0T14DRAFT_495969 [Immersiella caudata]
MSAPRISSASSGSSGSLLRTSLRGPLLHHLGLPNSPSAPLLVQLVAENLRDKPFASLLLVRGCLVRGCHIFPDQHKRGNATTTTTNLMAPKKATYIPIILLDDKKDTATIHKQISAQKAPDQQSAPDLALLAKVDEETVDSSSALKARSLL